MLLTVVTCSAGFGSFSCGGEHCEGVTLTGLVHEDS